MAYVGWDGIIENNFSFSCVLRNEILFPHMDYKYKEKNSKIWLIVVYLFDI